MSKIAYLIKRLDAGGKERQLLFLLKELSKSHEITLVVFNKTFFYKEEIDQFPVNLFVVPGMKSLKSVIKLYQALRIFKPDIIHSWDDLATIMVLPYKFFNRKTLIISSIRYAGKILKSIKVNVIQKVARFFSSIVVSNSKMGLEVEQLHNHRKGVVIYNGIDVAAFDTEQNKPKIKVPIFEKFSKRIVMVGNFTAPKDYQTFIEASKDVLAKNQDVAFICVGDGPNRQESEKLANKYLGQNIFFLGQRKDIPELLREMNIGVLLNNTNGHAEGISNSIMEYMCAGLPVIATNAGGTPEIVKDDISGYLVESFNKEVVAEKIQFLLDNPDHSKKMGLEGRKIIMEKFNLDIMIGSYEKLYGSLLKKAN